MYVTFTELAAPGFVPIPEFPIPTPCAAFAPESACRIDRVDSLPPHDLLVAVDQPWPHPPRLVPARNRLTTSDEIEQPPAILSSHLPFPPRFWNRYMLAEWLLVRLGLW